MADISMNDFLLQYYMQTHFNGMPSEALATFHDYIKAGDDFRGNMKTWKKKLMHQDVNGNWVRNDLPDPNDAAGDYHLKNEEWKSLFLAFQEAFQNMDADKKSFKDNSEATSFVEEYFGAGKLFTTAAANPTADAQIQQQLLPFLTRYRNGLELYFRDWGIITDDFTYSKLLSGLDQNSKKYNTDPKFQKRVVLITQYIARAAGDTDFQRGIRARESDIPDLSAITSGFDTSTVNPFKLQYFRDNYASLLDELYKNKKIFDEFKRFDNEKITGQITKAKENVGYDNKDSKDFLPLKRQDEITPWQRMHDWVSDKYTDCFGKYQELRGDHQFFSDQARTIFKAIGDKAKPADGIQKILDNAGKIKDSLRYKSASALTHFEWFEEALTELSQDKKLSKSFAGALRNGKQMEKLISEIIIKAIDAGKDKEAKTAMEILYAMRYGYTTSKIMDAFSKQDFKIFSDGKLSWNKHEVVQFVTNALDKSLHAAFKGIGYTITFVNNAIQRRRGKFNGKLGKMRSDYDRLVAQDQAEQQNLRDERDALQEQRQAITDDMDALRRRGVTEANLDAAIGRYEGEIQIHNQDIQNNITNIERQVAALNAAGTPLPDTELDELSSFVYGIQQGMSTGAAPTCSDATIQGYIGNLVSLETDVRRKTAQLERKRSRRKEFSDAADAVNMMNERETRINTTLTDWNDNHPSKYKKYKELMAFWDMLKERGNSWIGMESSVQSKHNNERDAIYQQALDNYRDLR